MAHLSVRGKELEEVGGACEYPPGAPRSHGAHRGGAAGWERLHDGIAWRVERTPRRWLDDEELGDGAGGGVGGGAEGGAARRGHAWPWLDRGVLHGRAQALHPSKSVFDIVLGGWAMAQVDFPSQAFQLPGKE